jgi:hypothetical protein
MMNQGYAELTRYPYLVEVEADIKDEVEVKAQAG